jgi:hypothetical protein
MSSATSQRAPAQHNALRSRTEAVHERPSTVLGGLGVAVHVNDRCTLRPVAWSFATTTPDLPHARPAFTDRPFPTTGTDLGIPIALAHPYSFKGLARDAHPTRPRLPPPIRPVTREDDQRARRDSNPNLLIRRLGWGESALVRLGGIPTQIASVVSLVGLLRARVGRC